MDRQGSQQELREHQSHYEHHRVRFAEGDQEEIPADNDGLGYRTQRPVQVKQFQRQETPIGGRGGTPATTASTTTAPEVYWADDRENDANLSQYTFYREPTPTPPEGDEREKGLGHGGVIETGYHDHDEPSRQRRIWGFKRRICLIIGAAIVLLIIALGVGLGVGLSNKSSDGAPAESRYVKSENSQWKLREMLALGGKYRTYTGLACRSNGYSFCFASPTENGHHETGAEKLTSN